MSFMEEQVLGYKSPLYGRRTAQFKIHPFTFFEARLMLSGFSNEEQANLMKQELKEPMSYHSIISAIASGASKVNKIATKTGLESLKRFVSNICFYLKYMKLYRSRLVKSDIGGEIIQKRRDRKKLI